MFNIGFSIWIEDSKWHKISFTIRWLPLLAAVSLPMLFMPGGLQQSKTLHEKFQNWIRCKFETVFHVEEWNKEFTSLHSIRPLEVSQFLHGMPTLYLQHAAHHLVSAGQPGWLAQWCSACVLLSTTVVTFGIQLCQKACSNSFKWKGESSQFTRERINSEVAKIYSKEESSIHKIIRKKKMDVYIP